MQVGSPRELYDRPANVFVAGFIGSPAMNLFDLPVADGGVLLGDQVFPVSREALGAADAPRVTLGVRPEDLDVADTGVPIEVDVVEELGADAYVYGRSKLGDSEQQIITRVDGRRPPLKGDTVHVTPRVGHVHLFRTTDGQRLPA
jgi:multiple sugar transport system ATP-binding protein